MGIMFGERFHMNCRAKSAGRMVLSLGMILLMSRVVIAAEVVEMRSTADIKSDLKATRQEYREVQELRRGLDRSSRQSANTARSSAVRKILDFMERAVKRREKDLGKEMTLKQQDQEVRAGTTEVTEVGSPVPTNRRNGGRTLYDASDGDRLHLLLNMQTLQVSARNISRSATDGQDEAFTQFTETTASFGQQLSWAVEAMQAELDRREPPSEPDSTVVESEPEEG